MNHNDRQTLGTLLDQLWATRNQRTHGISEGLDTHQRELLAAAMLIVAGGPNDSALPNPWPTSDERWTARPPYNEQPRWRDRLLNWLASR